jgi:V/A-type H+-transporting ATPase subunit D
MAKLNLPPTKSSLMRVKEQLSIAREGYDLLEQKREILVLELMQRIEEVKFLEKEIDERVESAYKTLKKLLLNMGRDMASEASERISIPYRFQEKTNRLIGLSLPSIQVEVPHMELQYSFVETNSLCDKTMVEFFEYLKLIARMAEIRTVIWRLAKEVKKTQRRVNALEKLVIPDTLETKRYIEDVLEERDREIFAVQKILKSRLQKRKLDNKKNNQGGGNETII